MEQIKCMNCSQLTNKNIIHPCVICNEYHCEECIYDFEKVNIAALAENEKKEKKYFCPACYSPMMEGIIVRINENRIH